MADALSLGDAQGFAIWRGLGRSPRSGPGDGGSPRRPRALTRQAREGVHPVVAAVWRWVSVKGRSVPRASATGMRRAPKKVDTAFPPRTQPFARDDGFTCHGTTDDQCGSRTVRLLVVRPETEELDDPLLFEDLMDEAVLDVDAA